MKSRFDFVSNSSSSSFVVSNMQGNATLFAQKYAETFNDCDVPGLYRDSLTIYAYAKNKDFQEVLRFFHPNDCDDSCNEEKTVQNQCSSINDRAKEFPEEEAWDHIQLDFDDIPLIAWNISIAKKITRLRFSAYDDYQKQRLATFFKFCKAIGCNPDDSESERDFLHEDESVFETKMQKKIYEYEKMIYEGEGKNEIRSDILY